MKRKLKSQLKKKKLNTIRHTDKKYTSYNTANPETDTYQEVREEGESSRQLTRNRK